MLSIRKTLETIFAKIDKTTKPRREFFIELFELLPCILGRFNFINIARYSKFNECTLRRNFAQVFDWVEFNYHFLQLAFMSNTLDKQEIIAAMDCSYIEKAGKHTFGMDKFWSGVARKVKNGLEISTICLIDVVKKQTWFFSVKQTPPGLSSKEGNPEDYTRTDFYIKQLKECIAKLPNVVYYVGDGFYSKEKIINVLLENKKHLISKLRPDSNLNYLYDRIKNPKAHGNQKFDGKVNWNALNLDKWNYVGVDEKHSHLRLYSQILYSPHFKRNLHVLFVWDTRDNVYTLLFSTDLTLSAQNIIKYYQLRFKIEILFRDAKQFTGLTHCQARDEEKLDFHFNMSFTALNLFQYEMIKADSDMSMNSFVRKAYNTKLIKILFSKLSPEAEFNVNFDLDNPKVQGVINLGQMGN